MLTVWPARFGIVLACLCTPAAATSAQVVTSVSGAVGPARAFGAGGLGVSVGGGARLTGSRAGLDVGLRLSTSYWRTSLASVPGDHLSRTILGVGLGAVASKRIRGGVAAFAGVEVTVIQSRVPDRTVIIDNSDTPEEDAVGNRAGLTRGFELGALIHVASAVSLTGSFRGLHQGLFDSANRWMTLWQFGFQFVPRGGL